jgi:hypothetical protein
MKLRVHLFGLIPLNIEVDVTYTDEMPSPNTGAYAYGRFKVFVRPKYREDKGIHEHEFGHIRQAWRNPWHGLMYKTLDWYKLKCEVECYRIQAQHYDDDRRPLFATFISQDYNLDITPEYALRLLND